MEAAQAEEAVDKKNKARVNETGDGGTSNKPKIEETEIQTVKKSKEEKAKKKDDKSIEQVLKALHTLGTSEEKLAAMCKKYSDIVEENRKLHLQAKQCEKRCLTLQREKDQIQSEQSKAILTKSRLENLCRELQKQNKAIKEESLSKIREEEEKRKVVSAKFQTALSEITALMQQNNENYSKLKEENLEMQNKFTTLCEQYELREQQVEKMTKQMQLESQLADVKLAKVKIDMFAEKELLANEKEQLLVELTAYQNKCQEMQKTEMALRNQITIYTEKYDEFQNALAKSNQIYSGFKGEIEKMSKKITRLEKETSVWKMKWEGSHKALLQMAAEKQQRDAELALAAKQLNQLQKLCRTLQAERSSLIRQLKNEGHVPKVEAGTVESASSDKLDINNESPSQVIDDNTNDTLEENVEKKDNESNYTPDINKLNENSTNEVELNAELKVVDNPSVAESSIVNGTQNDETIDKVTINNESPEECGDQPNDEGNHLKSEGQNSSSVRTDDNMKKDVNKSNANEPKKGKEGSKKKKK
ncbi:UNVERIFIED_CONTAM: hypothetical protein PYX00_003409 [Menopon gallinae]|uniref:Alpha-taxilin n=1 Tax=Menopon gallinae TaxID=328185 RepID=A0AAW2I0I7_9NEOP